MAPIGFGDPHPSHRVSAVPLALQLGLELPQKRCFPFFRVDSRPGAPVYSTGTLVGSDQGIRVTQNVRPVDLVVQRIEAKARFSLGLPIEFPL